MITHRITICFLASASTFTENGEPGHYIFENLCPGYYIVQIAPENFTAGGVLEGYVSTDGDSDPDNDTDNDDNGYVQDNLAILSYGVFSKAVTLTSGDEPVNDGDEDADSNLTLDFGFFKEEIPPVPCEISLGNIVWLDTDKNGVYDRGSEAGVDGVKVNLYWDRNISGDYTPDIDMLLASASTFTENGEPGNYIFENLCPGYYIVQIAAENFTAGALLEGYVSTAGDSDPDNDIDNDDNGYVQGDLALLSYGVFSKAVALTAGDEPVNDGDDNADSNLTVDFGFFKEETSPVPCEISLGNIVWIDTDKDGVYDKDTEAGVDGVKVNLYWDRDISGNYTPDTDMLLASASTYTENGEPGHYIFENLCPGYYIVQIAPENFTAGGLLEGYVSTAGDSDPDNDTDNDDNGYIQDNLAILSYGVFSKSVTLTSGDEPVNDGDDNPDSNLTVDFGFFKQEETPQCNLSLGNVIWYDLNRDGIYSSENEAGINHVKINLYLDSDHNGVYTPDKDEFTATATSSRYSSARSSKTKDGIYMFENLCPGDYIIQIAPENFQSGGMLDGYVSSPGESDPDDDTDNDDNGYPVSEYGVLAKAITITNNSEPINDVDTDSSTNFTVDFGFYKESTCPSCPCSLSLGNIVWHDTDNDGIYQIGKDTGINGVRINLYVDTDESGDYTAGTDEFVAASLTYTADGEPGRYIFRDLSEDSYIVQIDQSNFDTGEVLEKYLSVEGNSDPNNDVNNDDNGEPLSGYGVVSQAVILITDNEPVNDGDTDPNTNMSVDFGFLKTALSEPDCPPMKPF